MMVLFPYSSSCHNARIERTLVVIYSFLVLLSTFEYVESLSIHEINRRRQTTSATSTGTKSNGNRIKEESFAHVEELYFQQRLDHFRSEPYTNKKSNETFSFSQRYFYSSRFVHDDAHGEMNKDDEDSVNHVFLSRNDLPNDNHHSHSTQYETMTTNTKRHVLRKRNRKNNQNNFDNSIHASITTNEKKVHKTTANDSAPTFVFLCVGGEGPSLTKHVLVDSVHCTGDMIELASKLYNEQNANVHLFALEHRYYGNSYPTFSSSSSSSAVANENLIYLSSRQALMDIANFIQFTKDEFGLNDDGIKYITFGGSYPGMLAGWARLKFPHLVYAAVSNSAPVQVVLDFYEYNDVVASSLQNPVVGGSKECYDVVHDGHLEISTLLEKDDDESREIVADKFDICGGSDSLLEVKNQNAFLGDGVIYIPAQENDPSCDGDFCNIAKVCSNLTSSSSLSSMDKLAAIVRTRNKFDCTDINWDDMITYLSSDAAKAEGTRSWLWQTCTEMGFYQTCLNNTTCPYGRGYHELEQDFEICEKAFGIDRDLVVKNVQETMNNYGGWHMGGSRILSVNGDIDPWSALSMTQGGVNTTDLPSYWSTGASHHFWTHEVKSSDDGGINKTRSFIHEWVMSLLYSSD